MGSLSWLPESAIVKFVQTHQQFFKELMTATYKDGTKATIFGLDHPTIDTVLATSDVEATARKYEGRPVQANYYYERMHGYDLESVLVIRRFDPKADERKHYDHEAGRERALEKDAHRKEAMGTMAAEQDEVAIEEMLKAEDDENIRYANAGEIKNVPNF